MSVRGHEGALDSPTLESESWHIQDDSHGNLSSASSISGSKDHPEPLAVIGLAVKLPGAVDDAESFWQLLLEGRNAASKIPKDRFNIDAFYHQDTSRRDAINTRDGHFLDGDITEFDAPFFTISAQEAAVMDLQHRNMLEVSYRAFENAGLPLSKIQGSRTGVYTGSFDGDYKISATNDPDNIPLHAATGTTMTMLPARLSWFYNLKGPCFNVDTACSSSMVALDSACQALRSGECEMALVGGSNTISGINTWVSLANMGFLSPDGRCFSFDHRANGYARGEGFTVVLIKRLKAALEDGDNIRAVIRSSGVNQDGRTPAITQPSAISQAELMKTVYEKADLNYNDTQYFEAHGPGTALGDPIECQAIGSVFSASRRRPLYVGSVKSNIGHLEGASGLASFIKTILVLEHGVIPPNATFERINPRIDAERYKLMFPSTPTPWPLSGLRRASVSSFGYGGTNGHVVVEDAAHYLRLHGLQGNHQTRLTPPTPDEIEPSTLIEGQVDSSSNSDTQTSTERKALIILSSFDESGPGRQAEEFENFFTREIHPSLPKDARLCDIAYTLSERRTTFSWRAFAICNSKADLKSLPKVTSSPRLASDAPRLSVVFTGQGAQYAQMSEDLFAFPTFSDVIAEAQEVLSQNGCSWSLQEELLKDASITCVNDPELSQPVCTAVQIGLVRLYREIGLQIDYVVGHSSGEIACAYAKGALDLPSAMKVSYFRGQAAMKLRNGQDEEEGMMAVGCTLDILSPHLVDFPLLSIACFNSPGSMTISGPMVQIHSLKDRLTSLKLFNRVLKTGVAYHSAQMLRVSDWYKEQLESASLSGNDAEAVENSPTMISSVTGHGVSNSRLREAQYWIDNFVQPVQFWQAIQATAEFSKGLTNKRSPMTILEIGPHCALKGPINEIIQSLDFAYEHRYYSALERGKASIDTFFSSVGGLFCDGHDLSVLRCNALYDRHFHQPRFITSVPGYSFNHKSRFWTESRAEKLRRNREHARHELLGLRVGDWSPLEPRWRLIIRLREMPWVTGHRVNGQIVYPATGYLAMAIEGLKQLNDTRSDIEGFLIKEAVISHALVFENDQAEVELCLSFRNPKTSSNRDVVGWDFVCHSLNKIRWQEHCRGKVELELRQGQQEQSLHSLDEQHAVESSRRYKHAKTCSVRSVGKDHAYGFLSKEVGFAYQGAFQQLEQIACNDKWEATAKLYPARWLQGPEEIRLQPHTAHPAITDSLCQLALIALSQGASQKISNTVPTRLRDVWVSSGGLGSIREEASIFAYAKTSKKTFRGVLSSIVAFSEGDQRPIFSIGLLESSDISNTSTESLIKQPRSLSFGLKWMPDIDTMSEARILQQCCTLFSKAFGERHFSRYLDLLCHKRPNMRILQVGSILPETLDDFINVMTRENNCRFQKLVVTDPLLLNQEQLEWKWPGEFNRIEARSLNVEASLEHDDLDLASFDLIIWRPTTPSSLHSSQALINLANLLNPNGKLAILGTLRIKTQEISQPPKEDALQDREQLNRFLLNSGFTEAEVFSQLRQVQKSDDDGFMITSVSKAAATMSNSSRGYVLIHDPDSEFQVSVALHLQAVLSSKYCKVATLSESVDAFNSREDHFISLLEIQSPFLSQITEESYNSLKRLFNTVSNLLWVGQIGDDEEIAPSYSLVDGLSRTVRGERQDMKFTTLRLQLHGCDAVASAENILQVMKNEDRTRQDCEFEYREEGGFLHVGRLQQEKAIDEAISARHDSEANIRRMRLGDCPPVKLTIASVGQLQTLRFVEDAEFKMPLGSEMVQIEVRSTDLSFADVLTALGRTSHTELGTVCAGIVTQVGANVSGFKPGDQVIAFYLGVIKNHARLPSETLVHMPQGVDMHAAVGLLMPMLTAHIALFDLARLSEGETILIHSAAGATGQAAVQIAKYIGAQIIATVSTQEKAEFLTAEYGIPASNIFSSRSTEFAEGVKALTDGEGVDVAFNSLTDEKLIATWESMAPCGRFIEIGKKNIYENSGLPMAFFARNVSFHCLDLRDPILYRRAKVPQRQKDVLRMLQEGALSPIQPTAVVPASEMIQAFRKLAGGKSVGKFVIEMKADCIVPASLQFKPSYTFPSNATYVISGGLGGLGMGIAKWMISRGARNFILLSRYGPRTQKHLHFLTNAQSIANIQTPACDIVDEESVRQMLTTLAPKMPPIRGCIQSHMLIQDRIFENMDYGSWRMSIDPKVKGSMNLHKHLPADMDFCVFLSSIAGTLGSPSQANYAAGNTFQDGLAAYRIRQGRKTISLNLGWMEGEGFVAENERVLQNMRSARHLSAMTLNELYGVLDVFCDPQVTANSLNKVQIAFGVEMPGKILAKTGSEPEFMQTPLWRVLRNQSGPDSVSLKGSSGQTVDPGVELASVSSSEEALTVVTDLLKEKLSQISGIDVQQIDVSKTLMDFGVDSLLAVELQNWCVTALKSEVSVFDLLSQEPFHHTAALVAARSQHCGKLFTTDE